MNTQSTIDSISYALRHLYSAENILANAAEDVACGEISSAIAELQARRRQLADQEMTGSQAVSKGKESQQ